MCVRHSAAAAGCYVCLCTTHLAAGAFRKEEDANQQEVKLSTQQQDSGPEVSRVTCQAKEITTNQRLHSSVDSGQRNTLSTQFKRWWHDITEVCVIPEPCGIVVSCRISNLRL